MTTGSSRANDEAQIRALIDDWEKAMRAKDVDGVMSHYAADSVAFDLAPPLISTGADANGLQAWFSTCHSLIRLSGTKSDGEKVDVWFRLTLGFSKTGGEWRIAQRARPRLGPACLAA